ncbi:hypothetical protein CEXT_84981 [Caerostris extrusa]|uniref:Uncharacterized protein n=1 Tax=Caerostris extrusa TaxID=172846 RepID=A0AAV4TK42_CAEEX|nr:hypothetical protein CEXT_84981 [Caerostris extrusa]
MPLLNLNAKLKFVILGKPPGAVETLEPSAILHTECANTRDADVYCASPLRTTVNTSNILIWEGLLEGGGRDSDFIGTNKSRIFPGSWFWKVWEGHERIVLGTAI